MRSLLVLAAFEHGAYYYTVDSESVPATKIVALSKLVYKEITS